MILNTQIFNQVVAAAKAKAANSPAWLRAINRAVIEIQRARYWAFDGETLAIESTTSRKLYRVDAAHTCEARNGVCKHRAARRLLQRYTEALAQPAPVAPQTTTRRTGRISQTEEPCQKSETQPGY
jgi:hypothetical protein